MLLIQYVVMYKLILLGEQVLAKGKKATTPFCPLLNAHFIQFDHIL